MCDSRTDQQHDTALVAWKESAGQTQINSYRQLGACSPTTHRHAARRSAGCCFIHSASCGAPIKQDCIETPAKSELVMICSWQFTGEERLQSTAMTLITTGESRGYDGVGAANPTTSRRLVPYLDGWINRPEVAAVYRAGLSN